MTPIIGDGEGSVLVCAGCRRSLSVPDANVPVEHLPPGWRYFQIDGWVGDFVACSDDHEALVRDRARRGRIKP